MTDRPTIDELLAAAGLTRVQLAEKAGIMPGRWRRMLAGVEVPSRGTVLAIAEALGCSVEELTAALGVPELVEDAPPAEAIVDEGILEPPNRPKWGRPKRQRL
jgi:transcriptional regulator with XRE-family HTH domain